MESSFLLNIVEMVAKADLTAGSVASLFGSFVSFLIVAFVSAITYIAFSNNDEKNNEESKITEQEKKVQQKVQQIKDNEDTDYYDDGL